MAKESENELSKSPSAAESAVSRTFVRGVIPKPSHADAGFAFEPASG